MNRRHIVQFISLMFPFAVLSIVSAMTEPEPPLPEPPLLLPNDIMPAAPDEPNTVDDAADIYEVAPILFVPADVTPHPYGLAYVDRHMGNTQRWYAEQLRGKTFTLRPALLIIGLHPRTFYFGNCYPPNLGGCSWGYATWDKVFAELDSRGYNLPPRLIQGVFFQGEGMGTALGGGRRFLVGFQPDTVFPDCTMRGCAHNVNLGGVAHELGHALGLPHPDNDPEWGDSVMGTGFYGFPLCVFINTPTHPEYDQLKRSPFMNMETALKNPGFEGCLKNWTIEGGKPHCTRSDRVSGYWSLALDGPGNNRISQTFPVDATQPYDFSGWVRAGSLPVDGKLQIQIQAVQDGGVILETLNLVIIEQPTAGWIRVGQTVVFPAGTDYGTLTIATEGSNVSAFVDNLNFSLAGTPPMPLISGAFDGDAVGTDRPLLSWSPVELATSFEVQIAADPLFETLLEEGVSSGYAYQMIDPLPFDQYSFWRVRSVNAAGESDWSPAWSVIPRRSNAFFNDEFEESGLGASWSIVREDPTHWHISGVATRRWWGYLAIDTQSGDLDTANNARNIVRRATPPGDFAAETLVSIFVPLNANYQQGGLIIYRDDDNYIKLAHVYRNSWRLELEVEQGGAITLRDSVYLVDETRLKIERRDQTYTAYYSTNGVNWRPLGEPVSVDWPDATIGLTAYAGPATTNLPAVAFNWLRFTEPCREVKTVVEPDGAGAVTLEGVTCEDGRLRPTTPLHLTAQAAQGYIFDHWSGGASGSANPLDLTVDDDLNISAHFVENYPPVAVDDHYQVTAGETLAVAAVAGVLANDTDPDDDVLVVIQSADAGHGILVFNSDGSFVYTPQAGFVGEDSFTYRVSDGVAESEAATVTIAVNPVILFLPVINRQMQE